MVDGWFSKPVAVAVGVAGDVRIVENARDAMALLSDHWRNQGSQTHKAAKRACQDAMRGDVAADTAREAFVAAASEARVLAD